MTDVSQPTVDPSGISRTADGQIQDGQTTQESPSPATGTQPTESGSTLLTETKPNEPSAQPPASSGAPEAYADYKVPEGFTLDPQVKTEADAIFKGLGLNQEQAQSLVDFYTAKTTEAHEAPMKAYETMKNGWREQTLSDPTLRGKVGPGQEVNVRISKALDGLGDSKLASDFKQLMDLTGVGNHPAFIHVLNKFAEKLTEGSFVAGRGPAPQGQSPGPRPTPSAAEAMWPNLVKR